MAEKGAAQAKDNYEKIQAATEEATELLKGAYTTAAKGAQTTTSRSSRSPASMPTPPLTTPMNCWG